MHIQTEEVATTTTSKTSQIFPPPTTNTSAKDYLQETTIHIESLIHLLIHTTSNHTLSPTAPIWPYLSPTFTCRGTACAPTTSLLDILHTFERYWIQYPEYNLAATGMYTVLNSRVDEARVYVNVEIGGGPDMEGGLRREAVSVYEVRKGKGREGAWIIVGVETMSGSG